MLAALRRATAPQHAQIEQLLRLDQPFDLARYTSALQGFEAFLRGWEPRLEAALPDALRPWFRDRRRGALARADLDALGAPANGEAALPAIDSVSDALGSLYVMEGSALGGQVIAKQARDQHGLSADHGAAYFSGWGARTAGMWREFQQVLAQQDADGADHAAAGACAQATFGALIRTFEGTHVAA